MEKINNLLKLVIKILQELKESEKLSKEDSDRIDKALRCAKKAIKEKSSSKKKHWAKLAIVFGIKYLLMHASTLSDKLMDVLKDLGDWLS